MSGQQKPRPSSYRLYWRLFWLVALLGHIPVTWGAVANVLGPGVDRTAWSSLFLLTGSHLFFLLEITLSPSARLLTDRRAAVAFIIVVALLHSGILEHGMPELISVDNAQVWLGLTAAGAVVWRFKWRLVPHWARTMHVVAGHERLAFRRRSYAAAVSLVLIPSDPLGHWRRAPLRAPPSL